MYDAVVVYKNRTNHKIVELGYDVSNDTFKSEIRDSPDEGGELVATWGISFVTDGTDGELLLTLDDEQADDITVSRGYMDLIRVTGGEPIPAFDGYLEVLIREGVTERG